MARLLAAWHRRSGPERFETYTRWTLYTLLGFIPFMTLAVVGVSQARPGANAALLAFLVLTVAQVSVAILVIKRGVTTFQDGSPLPRRALIVLAVLTASTVTSALLALEPAQEVGWQGRGAAVTMALATALFALTPVLTYTVLLPASLAVGILGGVLALPALSGGQVITTAILYSLMLCVLTPTFRISIWMLDVVWEQERARGINARLAVAEERLRFSRDLHDVLGRTLSAVTLKSELAAELSHRGKTEDAAAQMLEVRELASDSLREVRAVVGGYRQADLSTELAGARAMLRSAGVRTRVVGDERDLPAQVQSALAWVVRESATNIVRHADATTCKFDLSVQSDTTGSAAKLTVTNDGVTRGSSTTSTAGAGLIGLAERLAELGGTVTTSAQHATFTLEARVPVVAHLDETMRTP